MKFPFLGKTGVEKGAAELEVQERSWRVFYPHFRRALPIIVLLTAAMAGCERLGFFSGSETAQLDSLLRLHEREMSRDIVLVEINQADYDNEALFNGTSPLDTDKVLSLIEEVKKYNPRVIGVDLDTSDWLKACKTATEIGREVENDAKCSPLRARIGKIIAEPEHPAGSTKRSTIIVWATVPRTSEAPLVLRPALGGTKLPANREGVPQFPVDRDGSVRKYESRVEVAGENGNCPNGEKPGGDGKCFSVTFARAILNAYPKSSETEAASNEKVIFNFYGDRYRFPINQAGSFLPEVGQPSGFAADITRKKEIDEQRAALLDGKIVLIGGAFNEARDNYFTPLGLMQGVELNALAIQSDLSGGGIREVHWFVEALIDLGIGSLIVAIFFRCEGRPRRALLWSLVIIPGAMLGSFLVFKSAAYWFNFIPLVVGVILHQLVELTEASVKLQKKLETSAAQPRQE
ncbi:MAG TPA: CHASE2 domain-containing protein [Candidatus Acidoferrum sp.]